MARFRIERASANISEKVEEDIPQNSVFVGRDGPEIEKKRVVMDSGEDGRRLAAEETPDFIRVFPRDPEREQFCGESFDGNGSAADLGFAFDDGEFEGGRAEGFGQYFECPFGPAFELVESCNERHVTPAGATQSFAYALLRRR